MKIFYFNCLVVLLYSSNMKAQDMHFSQIESNQLFINPAIAGTQFKNSASVNFRNQWSGVNNPFTTYGFSTDHRISKQSLQSGFCGIGLTVNKQVAGPKLISTINISASFAGHIKLNRFSSLGMGLNGGLLQKNLTTSGWRWGSQFNGNQYDGSVIQPEFDAQNPINVYNVGAGMVYNYSNSDKQFVTTNHDRQLTVGVALDHVNRPVNSFIQGKEKLPIRISVHGNAVISVPNSSLAFCPGFLFQQQGNAQELIIGSKYRYNLIQSSRYTNYVASQTLSLGTFYRVKDAFILSMEYTFSDFAFEISYDINTSSLRSYSHMRGGVELCLKYHRNAP